MQEMWETWVWFLGQEDPLEKEMATHSSILAWRMDRGAWQATVHGVTNSRTWLKQLNTTQHQEPRWSYWPSDHILGPRGLVPMALFSFNRRITNMFCESRSVMSSCLWLRELYSPWNSPGQNTGVGSLSLLQGIFPTQGSNPGLPHCRQILYQLSHQGSPSILEWVAYPFSSRSSWPRNWTGVSCIAGGFFTSWTTRETLVNYWKSPNC